MKIIQEATLETELARREVLRNFKNIKKAIEDFTKEAEGSKEYSRRQAIEAFKGKEANQTGHYKSKHQ